jgi:hypothetical protein
MANAKKQRVNHYLAYFDTLGFEHIFDLTAYEKDLTWSALKDENPTYKFPLQYMILRAKANPQRFPEIWTFTAEGISKEDLEAYAETDPQFLADLIRKNGNAVFVTPKQKQVIV